MKIGTRGRDLRVHLRAAGVGRHPYAEAALTGLRRAELCGLLWRDLDLDRARLVMRQAITTVDHEPSVGEVKSTRSHRVIDLDRVTAVVLRAQRKQ